MSQVEGDKNKVAQNRGSCSRIEQNVEQLTPDFPAGRATATEGTLIR